MLSRGIGTKADQEAGKKILRRACESGSELGCERIKHLGG
jgi:hypothetical protein